MHFVISGLVLMSAFTRVPLALIDANALNLFGQRSNLSVFLNSSLLSTGLIKGEEIGLRGYCLIEHLAANQP